MKRTDGIFRFMVLLAAGLLAGCSGDDTSDAGTEATEIRFNADVWRVMEGSRATTYDNAAALQSEGSFTCSAYVAEGTTPYISSSPVAWNTDKWEFADGKHYWPAEGSLDFFAYMPATKPSYIVGSITYAVSGEPAVPAPQFTCAALPLSDTGQSSTKEFVYALTTGQSKAAQGATGVALNFKHPLARITLQWSAADHTGITINSIAFKNVMNSGTCVIDGTTGNPSWTPPGDAADFTADFTAADMGGPFLVVPQTFTGGNVTIEVNATKEGDTETFTATVATAWAAGYSYTYSFTLNFKAKELIIDTTKYTEQW